MHFNNLIPIPKHSSSSNIMVKLPDLAKVLFQKIGEDPNREGLQKTPERFAKALMDLTEGYQTTGREVIGEGIFESESSGPVCVQSIEFFSLCEHIFCRSGEKFPQPICLLKNISAF